MQKKLNQKLKRLKQEVKKATVAATNSTNAKIE